jgi:pantoate--beta-alanine ligase
MSDPGSSAAVGLPRVVSATAELRAAVAAARAAGKKIGLIPTMGALHQGHLSLVQAAEAECDCSIVSIFVNPTQFGPQEDFDRYPRTLPSDLELLSTARVELVYAPDRQSIYPQGFSTFVGPPDLARPWEGQCRPGHFRGVATIVLKLFNLAQADVAYFGQKDYQQVRVIQQMVQDLDVPIAVRVCPTVREADGLAMSSRNRYLTAQQRGCALGLWQALTRARDLVAGGERHAERVLEQMRGVLQEHGITRIDYTALVDPDTLQSVTEIRAATIVLVAAHVGQTRLIDNLRLEL